MSDAITLRIYRAPSGQWSGKLIDSTGEEIGGIAGCDSAEDVEQTAYDRDIYPSTIEVIDESGLPVQ
jgi:hypothetical protein